MVLVLLSAMLSADHQSVLKLYIHNYNSHSLFSCFIQIEYKTGKGISCADPYFSRRGGGCWGGGPRDIWIFKFSGGGVRGIFSVILLCEFWIWEFRNLNFRKLNFPGGGGCQDPPTPSRSVHVYFKCKQYLFCVRHDCLFNTPVILDE